MNTRRVLAAVVLSAIALGAAGAQQGTGDKKPAAAPTAQQAGKAKADTGKKAETKKSSKKGTKKGGMAKDSTKAPATKKP